MRQIGSLNEERAAHRFAAYLITQSIAAHAEGEGREWVIWVRDENDVERSKDALHHFQTDPDDARYDGVEQTAYSILREERARREQAQKNVVEVGKQWHGPGGGRRSRLTIGLIVVSVLVSFWTTMGKDLESTNHLLFAQRRPMAPGLELTPSETFRDILSGQVWRLVTPIFLHGSPMHLLFNMMWVYYLGGQIEHRKGAFKLLGIVVLSALVSNLAQAWIVGPFFLGMSGVVFALFGYVWMKTLYDPQDGLFISSQTVTFVLIFFFLCFVPAFQGMFGAIANAAHAGGLIAGLGMGYASAMLK